MAFPFLIPALTATAGFIGGALARQPEINRLKKQVQILQSEVSRLQKMVSEQQRQVSELKQRYNALTVFNFLQKRELNEDIQTRLCQQYTFKLYLQFTLEISRQNTVSESSDKYRYIRYVEKILAGDDLSSEDYDFVIDFVYDTYGTEINNQITSNFDEEFASLSAA